MNFTNALTLLTLLMSLTNFAQTTDSEYELSLNNGTLDNQFEYVMTKSNSFKGDRGLSYQVINVNWLKDLKSHVLDSIKVAQNNLKISQIKVTEQTQEITNLKSKLTNTENDLEESKNKQNSMSLFGIQMSKGGYSGLMWSIIGILLALLLFFIYQFKNSIVVTKESKLMLTTLEDEFEEHRKTAVEREQKVRRLLQDEINKQRTNKNKN